MLSVPRLKPEIRLAQAVSQFEADLSSEQKATFRTYRSQSRDSPPDLRDVMRLTAWIDRQASGKIGRGRCFGPRLTKFLQAVQQFAALGDIMVGGSQNLIACGVWAIVRISLLSVVNFSAYLERLSCILMEAGRSAPRYQTIALICPQSENLQSYLSEYFIVVVRLCHQVLKFTQKSTLAQFTASLDNSDVQAYQSAFDLWANSIKDEASVLMAKTINEEAQEGSRFRSLSTKLSDSASLRQQLQANLRVLNSCSTHDYETAWKQTRKIGNTTIFNQTSGYLDWKCRDNSCTLNYTGKLGSGKSVLLANIVDDLNLESQSRNVAVAYFFCRHDIPESLEPQTIIGSLARQLLLQIADIATLTEFIDETNTIALDFQKLYSLLRHVVRPESKVYFVLDGLDECDAAERDILISQLRNLQDAFLLLLCVSIRLEPGNMLKSSLQQLTVTHSLSIPDNNPDIAEFISAELENLLQSKKLVIGHPALILDIQDALLRRSQGMFLWVALQIGSLCDMKTDDDIRQALVDLPRDLPETLSRILRKAAGSGKPYQRRILELITIAQRPLTTDELRDALSVVPGNTAWSSSRLINDINSILPCCGSILTVDEEERTIRLVHHCVKQFLLSEFRDSANIPITIDSATKTMADIIMTYLSYGLFETQVSTMRVPQILTASAPSQIIRSTLDSSSSIRSIALKLLKSRKQLGSDIGKTLADASSLFSSRPVDKFNFYSYAKSHGLQHIMQSDQAHTVSQKIELHTFVILGDEGVGKEEIAHQFIMPTRFDLCDPAREEYYRKLAVVDDVQCLIETLDTSGQEEYVALRDQLIREGECFVLVYNIFSRSSFTRIRRFHAQIRRIRTSISPGSYPKPATGFYEVPIPNPIMLVGHDFHGKSKRERQVSETEGQSLALELGCDFTEASTENGINVNNIFFDLVRTIRRHKAAVIHLSNSS